MTQATKPREEPTFVPLGGSYHWRPDNVRTEPRIIEDSEGHLALPAVPTGPLGFFRESAGIRQPNETLGGLVLPHNIAVSGRENVFLLDGSAGRVLRLSLRDLRFFPLGSIDPAHGIKGTGEKGLDKPRMIAATSRELFVVDVAAGGGSRILVFDVHSLALVDLIALSDSDPGKLDLAVWRDEVFLLDFSNDSIQLRHRKGSGGPFNVLLPSGGAWPAGKALPEWRRLAVDQEKQVYLLNLTSGEEGLEEIHFTGEAPGYRVGERFSDARQLSDRFAPPAIRVDERGRLRLADPFLYGCAGESGLDPVTLFFDDSGERGMVDPEERPATNLFERSGIWYTELLDSDIFDCSWHRIEVEAETLPPGARLEIDTFTAPLKEKRRTRSGIADKLWQRNPALIGSLQAPRKTRVSGPENDAGTNSQRTDFLIQNPPGQLLFLRIRLSGDGRTTPRLRGLRVHFPRSSYLQHLPAIFSGDSESRHFLERFLSIFQTDWDDIERRVENLFHYFDPDTVPDAFLPYLASWLDVPLEGDWGPEQNRRLLVAAIRSLGKRGTPRALRDHVAVYLHNITGIEPERQEPFPVVIEGFRQRPCSREGALLDDMHTRGLWGREVVGRMQLGEYSREGEARMVSIGSPETDFFRVHAHRFQVIVPASWIRKSSDLDLLQRAIAEESPAHVCHSLSLVDSQSLVGLQSCVGVNTIVGGRSPRRIPGDADDVAEGRTRTNRLGVDTWLASANPCGGDDVTILQ